MAKTKQPKRIQRKRTKGWQMPSRTAYVGRPGKWGNPFFKLKDEPDVQMDREFLVAVYKLWLDGRLAPGLAKTFKGGDKLPVPPSREKIQKELGGKSLACWCPPKGACHADILLEVANAGSMYHAK